MAETNILLGVGGTGAKVVEAALVLLAAGLGPRTVHVGLVDQDSTNGNVTRARRFLSDYGEFRRLWSEGASNKIDWAGEGGPALGKTAILPLFEKPQPSPLWCPSLTEGSLKAILGENLSDEQRHLFNLLFMEGKEEQDLPLEQGYRGRAHVGSAALVASLLADDCALIARLKELMESAGQQSVNIFIVGSAFGGTGASGFPTLARHLNNMRKTLQNRERIAIAGLLMLPYFEFRNPEDEDTVSVVTSNELLPKAQLALEYYENLFKHEEVFDRFFVAGWRPTLFKLDYHAAGSDKQTNPALLPELVAATSVCEFFARPETEKSEGGEAGSKVPVMTSAREAIPIRWRDLPPGLLLRKRVGQLLRFAVYWRYHAKGLLTKKSWVPGRKTWAQELAGDVDIGESEDQLHSLDRLLDDILAWAATVEKTGERYWVNGPWSLEALKAPGHVETPTEPIALGERFPEPHLLNAFDRLIKVDGGDPEPRQGAAVHDYLVRAQPSPGEHRGIGRAIAAAFDAVTVDPSFQRS
jgi:hypothetical protein